MKALVGGDHRAPRNEPLCVSHIADGIRRVARWPTGWAARWSAPTSLRWSATIGLMHLHGVVLWNT